MKIPRRKERRKFPRKGIKVELERGSFSVCFTRNISGNGLFAETKKPFPLDSEVFLDFFLPGIRDKFKLKGKVIRRVTEREANKDGYVPGMGIEFIEISQANQHKIITFAKTEQKRRKVPLKMLLDLHLQEEQFLFKLRPNIGDRKEE
jgi:Tfp pilus assembly protein PilZ